MRLEQLTHVHALDRIAVMQEHRGGAEEGVVNVQIAHRMCGEKAASTAPRVPYQELAGRETSRGVQKSSSRSLLHGHHACFPLSLH